MYLPFVASTQNKYREQISGELFDDVTSASQRSREIMFTLNCSDPNDHTTHFYKVRPLIDWQNLYSESHQ